MVSTVAVTAELVTLLPAVSTAFAVKLWLASGVSADVVKLKAPRLTVAAPRSVAPSKICTFDRFASLAVPVRVSVVSLVMPPELMVPVAPVSVVMVLLRATVGAVASTIAVTAAVVVLLPAVSTATAVKLWLASGVSADVVKLKAPRLTVAAPRSVAPSKMCTFDRFASLTVPVRANVVSLVMPPELMVPVAPVSVVMVLLRATVGAMLSTTRPA